MWFRSRWGKITLNAEIAFHITEEMWFGQLKNLYTAAVLLRIVHILDLWWSGVPQALFSLSTFIVLYDSVTYHSKLDIGFGFKFSTMNYSKAVGLKLHLSHVKCQIPGSFLVVLNSVLVS